MITVEFTTTQAAAVVALIRIWHQDNPNNTTLTALALRCAELQIYKARDEQAAEESKDSRDLLPRR